MSYRGLDYGSGIQHFGDLMAQGYKDRQELEFQRQKYNADIAQRDIDNALKQQQVNYSSPADMYLSPAIFNELQNPQSPLDAYKQGADFGRSQPPPHTGIITPGQQGQPATYQQLTGGPANPNYGAPQGYPGQMPGAQRPNMVAQDPYAGFTGNRSPTGHDWSPLMEQLPDMSGQPGANSPGAQKAVADLRTAQTNVRNQAGHKPIYVAVGKPSLMDQPPQPPKAAPKVQQQAVQGTPDNLRAPAQNNDAPYYTTLPLGNADAQEKYQKDLAQYNQDMLKLKLAKQMGLQIDENGGVHGPGRQIQEFMDIYKHGVGSNAAALVAGARSQAPVIKESNPAPSTDKKDKGGKPFNGTTPAERAKNLEVNRIEKQIKELTDNISYKYGTPNSPAYTAIKKQVDDLRTKQDTLNAPYLNAAAAPQSRITAGQQFNGKTVTKVAQDTKNKKTWVKYSDGSTDTLDGIR